MRHYHPLLLASGLLLMSACDNDTPVPEDDCLDPSFRAPVEITLDVDRSMTQYRDIDSTRYYSFKGDSIVPHAQTRGNASWQLRYYVAAYRRNSDTPFDIVSSMDNKIRMDLPPDKFTFIGWADHVPEDNGKSWYYHTDDFTEMLLRHKYDYEPSDFYKVPYRGKTEQRVAYTTTESSISLKSAMAGYRIVVTDPADFKTGKILVTYTRPMPAAIHGVTGDIVYNWSDISYQTTVDNDVLASDYVFSSDESETSVFVRIEIYDENDILRARVRELEIPLINGGLTTVRGNFYSVLDLDGDYSGGGITIDPDFEATIEIEI